MLRPVLYVMVSLVMAAPAAAQEEWTTPGAPGSVDVGTVETSVVTEGEPDTYEAVVLSAARKIVLRDFGAALSELRDASSREPARPEAYCRLGDAQFAQGDMQEARAAYESCVRFASTGQNPHELALALIGLARIFEQIHKNRDERQAWQRVLTSAKDEGAQAMAQARLLALDATLTQSDAYVIVRKRIAERAQSAAQPASPSP